MVSYSYSQKLTVLGTFNTLKLPFDNDTYIFTKRNYKNNSYVQ